MNTIDVDLAQAPNFAASRALSLVGICIYQHSKSKHHQISSVTSSVELTSTTPFTPIRFYAQIPLFTVFFCLFELWSLANIQ